MSQAKEQILDRIRRAVANAPQISYENIPREYYSADCPADNCLVLLEDRLEDYGCRVYGCAARDLADTVRLALNAAGKVSMLVATAVSRDWLPDGFTFIDDDDQSYLNLDKSDGVITGCALAIAETGTIVLRHSPEDGGRALTLLPDYHLCIVRSSQVVASVPDGIRLAAEFATSPITTISGPSATSDIEMTRVKGVHGPRVLDVIVVQDT